MSTFDLEALRSAPDKGPVTMLNLIKYRRNSADGSGSGRDAYQQANNKSKFERLKNED